MKNNVYLCKPQFYCIKVGFKGVKLYRHVFVMKRVKIIQACFRDVENHQTQPDSGSR